MWVYRTSVCGEHPIVLFKYEPTRSGSCAREFLKGFKGGRGVCVWKFLRLLASSQPPPLKKGDKLVAVVGAFYVCVHWRETKSSIYTSVAFCNGSVNRTDCAL